MDDFGFSYLLLKVWLHLEFLGRLQLHFDKILERSSLLKLKKAETQFKIGFIRAKFGLIRSLKITFLLKLKLGWIQGFLRKVAKFLDKSVMS